ncbi:MAG: hypothetical protein WC471_01645 [Candidatus Woesearchaeota archaeon]
MKKAAILILALLLVATMYGCAKETTTDASMDLSSDISDIDSIDQTSVDTSDLDALEQDLDTQI